MQQTEHRVAVATEQEVETLLPHKAARLRILSICSTLAQEGVPFTARILAVREIPRSGALDVAGKS